MKTLEFYRTSGANNTFLICSLLKTKQEISRDQRIQWAQIYCDGFFGFKNDGLIFLEPEKGFDFKWDFYNADGSSAEMCGNAARCVALIYQKLAEGHPSRCRFLSLSGPIETQILSAHQVRVVMPTLAQEKDLIIKNSHGVSVPGFYVNTGVPHFVLEQIPDFELAKELRSHESFGPKGTNVTFVEVGSPRKAVTFERGVEDFTQACGTGAVAAARYIYKKAPQQKTVQVQMPGGILSVEFFGPESTQVYLQGQAQIEFKIIVP